MEIKSLPLFLGGLGLLLVSTIPEKAQDRGLWMLAGGSAVAVSLVTDFKGSFFPEMKKVF